MPGSQEAPPSPAAVNRAIDSGVAWLREIQRLNGAFSRDERMGQTALLAYALLKSGVTPEDQMVARALARAKSMKGGRTYDQACLALALAAGQRPKDKKALQGALDTLVGYRGKHGTWAYPGGEEDLSNTQFALLGLHAGVAAGGDVPEDLWASVTAALEGYHSRDGGFGYSLGGFHPSTSMTAAGIGSLAICRLYLGNGQVQDPVPGDRSINDGLHWLDRRLERGDSLYTWYGIERVGALTGRSHIGGEDWYGAGAAKILKLQVEDGSFSGGLPHTAYSLLFLNRATGPKTGRRASENRVGKRSLHSVRDGDIHLQGIGAEPCQIWVSGWSKALLARHAWPGEAQRGLRISKVVWFVNGQAVQEIPGDPSRANESLRFEFEQHLTLPGKHQIQAQVHLSVPVPGNAVGSDVRVVNSNPMEILIVPKPFDPLVEVALEHGNNLLDSNRLGTVPGQACSARASSKESGHSPEAAIDGDYYTHWRADLRDPKPTLMLTLSKPILADMVLLTQPLGWPIESGALPRAFEAKVEINGKPVGVVRMHLDERRKGRLSLPEPLEVSRIEITLIGVIPGADPDMGGGIGEVELLLGE